MRVKKVSIVMAVAVGLIAATALVPYLLDRTLRLSALQDASRIAETELGPIEYWLGEGEGPVVLAIHGTPGGFDQLKDLQIAGFRVLAPSRPGYLRTPLSVGATPFDQADAFAVLIDHLDIESVAIVGHSGGGPSALAFAYRYPERTSALVVLYAVSRPWPPGGVSSFPPPPFYGDYLTWISNRYAIATGGINELASSFVPDPDNRQRIVNSPASAQHFEALVWSMWPDSHRGEGFRNDVRQFTELDLPTEQVSVPTLIVHGTKDANVSFDQSEELAGEIDGAQFHVVPDSDHFILYSHSAEVLGAVDRFLNTRRM